MGGGYEAFFGLRERPFSLTPDPRYFFTSRSHGAALDTLTAGLRRAERLQAVTADLGVGKTMLCRTLAEQLKRQARVCLVSNPLLTPDAFRRLVAEDLGAGTAAETETAPASAVIVIDEVQTMPWAVVGQLLLLISAEERHSTLHVVLVGQSAPVDQVRTGANQLDGLVGTKIELLPLTRDECAGYIEHRLTVAGGADGVRFSERAIDYVFALSGGVPRLVNLLCERALQEAAANGAQTVESATIDLAAATLQLLRARSALPVRDRRFRWFTRRVS